MIYSNSSPIIRYKLRMTVIENPRGDEHRRLYILVTALIIMSFSFMCLPRSAVDLEGEILNSDLLLLMEDQKPDLRWGREHIEGPSQEPVRDHILRREWGEHTRVEPQPHPLHRRQVDRH